MDAWKLHRQIDRQIGLSNPSETVGEQDFQLCFAEAISL
jgi:hypothetical protein